MPLKTELAFFERNRAAWLNQHKDKHVLIKGEELLGLYLNYAQIRRSHRRWSCGDSGTRVNSVISQVVFSAVSLPV